jgi:hypothetical protein
MSPLLSLPANADIPNVSAGLRSRERIYFVPWFFGLPQSGVIP